VTEQLDGTLPGIAASSYAADDGLLAELREDWPTVLDAEVHALDEDHAKFTNATIATTRQRYGRMPRTTRV
jgi:hypothetical protein